MREAQRLSEDSLSYGAMLAVQRVCQNIVLGAFAFVMFIMGAICAVIGSTNHAVGYFLLAALACFLLAYLKDRWLKEEATKH
jgi:hypothetical protein